MEEIRAFQIKFFDATGRKLKELICLRNEDPHHQGLNRALFMELITWSQRVKQLPLKCEVRLGFNTYSAEIEIPEFFTKVAAAKGWKISIHVNR